jgi:predicted secreted protein
MAPRTQKVSASRCLPLPTARKALRLAAAAALLLPALAWGQDGAPRDAGFDVVSFQAQASREVANDRIAAVLAAEASGSDPAALAASVNRRMSEALAAAKEVTVVQARSGSYQTSPMYNKDGRIEGWRVSQELRLESADFAAAARLIGRLQQSLVVRGMSLELSPDARRAAEDALISEAIAAFHGRAGIVRQAMKAAGYRVRSLDIQSSGGFPRPFAMARSAPAAAGPALEPGNSQVTVLVSGSIQLR